ncbi:putative quinate permease protein [Neofusicoccum parvum]|uniref:Quinate permease protein n=1 Tax=Neofusicoccum parvum TaxID=310453 RepID=A0ACB5SLG5_9PEZI|nr:putative quinate permease protein [Neofusicoccum parvum]
MGGGTSIWASPEWKSDPRQIFNSRLLLLTVTVAWAGCSYGFDQGNIGGVLTLPSFRHAFGLDTLSADEADKREGDIAAMMAAGGSAGALLAAPSSDFLGRKNSMLIFGFCFLIGATMQEIANLGVFYAGRLIAGIAIGGMSMLAPQYLAENSPKSVRGSLTTLYNLMIILALSLAFWINYGVSKWNSDTIHLNNLQWKLSMSIQIIPGGFMFLMMWFVLETPRALIARGKREQGLKNLCTLRGLPAHHQYVQQEYMEVCAQVDAEQELRAGHNYWLVIKDIFTIRSNTRRFFLAVTLFLFHKFTGTDSLNYFAPDIFEMIGVKGGSTTLLTTGVYGLVKLATTILYVAVIVDRVGRRRPLMVGAFIQATAMLYIALYVRFGNPSAHHGTEAGGIVGIIWIYLYAFGWSFGWSVAPYVVAAEIFPARIRSVCMAFCLFVNWIVDYGITKATPSMMTHLGYGTFLLYAVLTYIGVVFVYFCMPELKGRSIESMDDLFAHPLWTMFRRAYPTEEQKVRHDVYDKMALDEEPAAAAVADVKKQDGAVHVERV